MSLAVIVLLFLLFFVGAVLAQGAPTQREGCLQCLSQPPPSSTPVNGTAAESRLVWCASFCDGAPNVPARRTCRINLCTLGEELVDAQPFRSNATCESESVVRRADESDQCDLAAATALPPRGEFDWLVFILVFVSLCAFAACLVVLWLVFLVSRRNAA